MQTNSKLEKYRNGYLVGKIGTLHPSHHTLFLIHIMYFEAEVVLAPNALSTKHFDILSNDYLNKLTKTCQILNK
jgi:hypothetical protein